MTDKIKSVHITPIAPVYVRFLLCILPFSVACCCSGCGESSQKSATSLAIPGLALATETSGHDNGSEVTTRLGAGDVVEVRFLTAPELNIEQTIRPDGKISLGLIQDVKAAGLTPEELQSTLLTHYENQLIEPQITVIVREFNSQRIYVGGEVLVPGRFPIYGQMTVLEAIMQAGGVVAENAELSNVVVIRQTPDHRIEGHSIDLQDAIQGEPTQAFLLHPRDIVFVPRTRIVRLNTWIDQHINKLIPRSGGENKFNYSVGRSRIQMAY